MCFGSDTSKQKAAAPAAAPPPPSPTADQVDVTKARKAEDLAAFGTSAPSLRVDRSLGVAGTGVGLRM